MLVCTSTPHYNAAITCSQQKRGSGQIKLMGGNMKNTKSNIARTKLVAATLIVGTAVFGVVGSAAYSQKCRNCKTINASIADHDPGSLSDEQTARQLANLSVTNPVTEWNQIAAAFAVSSSSALSPVQQARAMAIVQVSVHDAVNNITGRYATYLARTPAPEGSTAEAAAIAAAHRVLRNLFPSGAATLDTMYTNSLAAHGVEPSDPGIIYGALLADIMMAVRANDGAAQAQFDYTAPGAGSPGVWTRINNAPALLPGWGNVTPFVIRSSTQFAVDAPPALDSNTYTRDYNEIKEIGSVNSTTRTPVQSQIALFWRASPTAIWNPVMNQALATRELDLSATARAYALMYMAAADAGISCWQTKYTYNFWRPQLAIRGGDTDGNDATVADPTWTPFISTPPHPDYISGHADNSSAMASVLESIFGEKLDAPISVTIGGITRQWDSFEEGVDEVIDARVYSGIHFRNSDIVGARQGRQIAQFVLTHALKPCKGRGAVCNAK